MRLPTSPASSSRSGSPRESADLVALAKVVAASRPEPNTDFDQYLMSETSLRDQARSLIERYEATSLVMLGDDDHLSVLLAAFTVSRLTVIEIDPRIVQNLERWKRKLALENLVLAQGDVSDASSLCERREAFESFYINPPFDRSGGGECILVWLDIAIDLCTRGCAGTVVLPVEGSHARWISDAWLGLQRFCADRELRFSGISDLRHLYLNSKDPSLESCNVHVRRVDEHI